MCWRFGFPLGNVEPIEVKGGWISVTKHTEDFGQRIQKIPAESFLILIVPKIAM